MSAKGRLIVLEGGEGSGKSTQAALLAAHLGAELTREPGGTELSEQIRALLLGEHRVGIDARAELFLMLAARASHVETVIRPLLSSGRDVVCDRYSPSTLAYQGYGRGLPLEDVKAACAIAEAGVRATLNVLLDVSSELAHERVEAPRDRIERVGIEFHERVIDGYRALVREDEEHWVVVDGSGTKEAVFERLARAVSLRLADHVASTTL